MKKPTQHRSSVEDNLRNLKVDSLHLVNLRGADESFKPRVDRVFRFEEVVDAWKKPARFLTARFLGMKAERTVLYRPSMR